MSIERIQIAESMYLNFIPTEKFKLNCLTMHFLSPLHPDTASEHAVLSRVLQCGCRRYPDMASVTRQKQYLYDATVGGYVQKLGETQIVGQTAWMLDNSVIPDGTDVFSETVRLFCDLWFSPLCDSEAFCEKFVQLEKASVSDAIRAKINHKSAYAAQRCIEEMCRNEAFGIPVQGTLKAVDAVSGSSAFAAYKYLLSHAPCEIYYVGRGNAAALADSFRHAISGIDRTDIVIPNTEIVHRAKGVRVVMEEQPAVQGKLVMGFRTGTCEREAGRAAAMVFNAIYGGAPTSKLFMNVREKMSLCYSCHSSFNHQKGIMLVSSGIENEKLTVAQDEILAQLRRMQEGEISEAEMDGARRYLIGELRRIEDDPGSITAWHLNRFLSGRNITLQEEISEILSVTKQDIINAACRATLDTVYFMRGTKGEGDF